MVLGVIHDLCDVVRTLIRITEEQQAALAESDVRKEVIDGWKQEIDEAVGLFLSAESRGEQE